MDQLLSRLIRNAIEKQVAAARARGALDVPPSPSRPRGTPAPSAASVAQSVQRPQAAGPLAPRVELPAAGSAIEAADPFAAVAAAALTPARSPAARLLAAFGGRDDLLAGIVLSEAVAPPLALRRERDR